MKVMMMKIRVQSCISERTKLALVLIALAALCAAAMAQEDIASYWLNKGNESLEQAQDIIQNRTEKEIVLNKALNSYESALEDDPQSALGWYKKGEVLIALTCFEEALPCINKSLEINPLNADAWYQKGIILTIMGRYEEAIHAYNESVVINSSMVDSWYMMGGTFAELGRFQEAVKSYDRAIEIKPQLSKAWLEMSAALKELGRIDESNETLAKAIMMYDEELKLNLNDTSALFGKGAALYNLGKYEASIQYFDMASNVSPRNYRPWYYKGLSLKALDRESEAEVAFAKARELGSPF
jgi:tetratricopeptide (TPR) repeat protein